MAFRCHPTVTADRLPRFARAIVLGSCTAGLFAAMTALGGCGSLRSDGVASLAVDPARYEGFHCKELISQWNGLVAREKQLRNLIDKASDGGGGTVIAAVAYRSDYDTVLEQQKVLKRTAAEKNCELEHSYNSDQGIR
jgi:hypothetical protein